MEFRYTISAKVETGTVNGEDNDIDERKYAFQGVVSLWLNGEDTGNHANLAWPVDKETWGKHDIYDVLVFPHDDWKHSASKVLNLHPEGL